MRSRRGSLLTLPAAARRRAFSSLCASAICLLTAAQTALAVEEEAYLGPCATAVTADGKTLYVANADARQLAVVRIGDGRTVHTLELPAEPSGLALSPDGARLYITCAAPASTICALDTASGKVTMTIPAGHTTMGPTLAPDGKRLYVCNRFNNDVSVIDPQAGRELARVAVVREPVGAAVTPDGKSVVVINHLPDDPAASFTVAARVTLIDVQTLQTTSLRLANGSTGLRSVCISPDGRYAYVTHILSNFELIPTQVDFGWTNTNAMSIIDLAAKELFSVVLLDDQYLGAANPWGVACTADGKTICVAHAGTHELSVIDRPALFHKLGASGNANRTGRLMDGPSILEGIRRRIKLSGRGPRGLAVAGSSALVCGYFSDTVDVVELSGGTDNHPRTIALGPRPRLGARRRGEMLFHDATICYQHWQSCASCHPDGRADSLNWDLVNDLLGNPKNTKSLLLAHRTPPAMATGVRPTAEAAVRSGIKHILFAEQPAEVAAAIDEYLKSLRPVPSPQLVEGRLSPAARRGRKLFESDAVGCSKCHPAPLFTDLLIHDVTRRGPYDFRRNFDVPSLVEVWRTAPYMHDGRYTTIRQLIANDEHGKKRGSVEHLRRQQIDDLVEYVLSL